MPTPTYEKLTPPKRGTRVTLDAGGRWQIPDDPVVCLIRGDGIGRDVACAARVGRTVRVGGGRPTGWVDLP